MATKFYLPNLLEYIYGFILAKGKNNLFKILDRDDFRQIRNEAAVRKFAEFTNLEDKIILLSKMGMNCAIFFWDKENQNKKRVEDIVVAYLDTDLSKLTEQLVKEKVFGFMGIDVIKSLQTISNICMGRVYSVNRRFNAQKNEALKERVLSQKIIAERNLDWYSKTVRFALNIETVLEPIGISLIEYRILLFLHTSPNGVTLDAINKEIGKAKVTTVINRMYSKNMVSFSLSNKSVILIDVYGIIILQQIFNKFP